jgi:hypothetical protein
LDFYSPFKTDLKKGEYLTMKRISILSFVLTISVIIVQPLQALQVDYTVQASFALLGNATSDPWGLGSNSGMLELNFSLAPPPSSTEESSEFGGYANAYYNDFGAILTLSGTTVDGTYTAEVTGLLSNSFSESIMTNDGLAVYSSFNLSGSTSGFIGLDWFLPKNYWGDTEVPPLPKLATPADLISPFGLIGETTGELDDVIWSYYSYDILLTTKPVPEPSTIVLMGLGLVGLAGLGRKKIKG